MFAEAIAPSPVPSWPSERARGVHIQRVAVLGAGTMGARIAAHLANSGVPVVLLDLPSGDKSARNAVVVKALEALKRSKPAAFFDPSLSKFITVGNFEEHLDLRRRLRLDHRSRGREPRNQACAPDARRQLAAQGCDRDHQYQRPAVGQIAEGMSEEFRRHWFGTHFFNPPRYMRLVEIIPTPEADPAAIAAIAQFADCRLGKEVVLREGHAELHRQSDRRLHHAGRGAPDAGDGPDHRRGGRAHRHGHRLAPNGHVPSGGHGWPRCAGARRPEFPGSRQRRARRCVAARLRGGNARPQMARRQDRAGFLQEREGRRRKEVLLGLDWKTLEYRTSDRAKFPALEMAKNVESVAERLEMLLDCDARRDGGGFHWRLLPALWNYAANCLPEIADDIVEHRSRDAGRVQLGDGALPALGRCRCAGDRRTDEGRRHAPLRRRWSGCSMLGSPPGIAMTPPLLPGAGSSMSGPASIYPSRCRGRRLRFRCCRKPAAS